MPEPLVVQTLSEKRAEILGRVAAYEAQIAQAKHDLAHVNATIRLFTPYGAARARAFYEREGWEPAGRAFAEPLLGLDLVEYRREL